MADRERELLFRAAPIVLRAMTPRWHLAQIVGHEGLGVCSWRRCSDDCVKARRLLLDLGDYLDGEGVTDERPLRGGNIDGVDVVADIR